MCVCVCVDLHAIVGRTKNEAAAAAEAHKCLCEDIKIARRHRPPPPGRGSGATTLRAEQCLTRATGPEVALVWPGLVSPRLTRIRSSRPNLPRTSSLSMAGDAKYYLTILRNSQMFQFKSGDELVIMVVL